MRDAGRACLTQYTLDQFSRRESIGLTGYARSDSRGPFTRARNRATGRRVARRDAAIEAGVAGAANRTIGRPRVSLPASLPGSPKHQQMLVGDGLAVIEKHGKPDVRSIQRMCLTTRVGVAASSSLHVQSKAA